MFRGERGPRGEQGPRGEKGDNGESALIGTAETMVARLVKADRARKWQVRILSVACALLLTVAAFTAKGYFDNQANTRSLKQASITNCENNNRFRLAQIHIWESNYALQAQEAKATGSLLTQFVNLVANNDPTRVKQIEALFAESGKAQAAEIQVFLKRVKALDSPKNCTALYSNARGASSTSGMPEVKAVSSSFTVEVLRSWNGGCLSVTSAHEGANVTEEGCGSAHRWWYDARTGQLSPEGHSDVAVGDSGGRLVLRAAPSNGVRTDNARFGPSGFLYDELYFGVHGTYWHADGSGRAVTLSSSRSLADYWAFLGFAQAYARGAV